MKFGNYILRNHRNDGFSTIELIVVLVVFAVIITIGIVRFTGSNNQEQMARAVAELIVSDLAFAQELAVSTGKAVVVTFTPGTDGGDGRRGYGHDPDVRGEGRNGTGRGHGYGWGHMHHNCGPGCGGGGGYSIQFVDGSPVPYPQAALVEGIRGQVTINYAITLQFDSSGRLITPDYTWGDNQTETNAVVLNDVVNVVITRETGKARVQG